MLNTTIALTTVENVEIFLGLEEGVYTPMIELAINHFSAMLEGLTGRNLKSRTYTDYRLSGTGSQYAYFPHWPITSISALTMYDSSGLVYNTLDLLQPNQLVLNNRTGKIHLPGDVFISGFQNVKLTAVAGITDASELALLERAVLQLIANSGGITSGGISSNLYKSEKLGSYSYTLQSSVLTSGVTADVASIIQYFANV